MRFSCEQCQARYSIADDKVRGKLVAVRCTRCGAKITVNGKALSEPEPEMPTRVAFYADALKTAERPRQAATDTLADGWFVIVDGQQSGPFGAAQVRGMLSAGRISARTYAWRDGQGDWKRASEIPALAVLLGDMPASAPAPLPPPVPETAPASPSRPAASAGPSPSPAGGQPMPFATRGSAPAPSLDNSLFDGEFESDPTVIHQPVDPAALAERPAKPASRAPATHTAEPQPEPAAADADPFAAVSDRAPAKPVEIGEQTRALMQKAGVSRRNPAWKVAVFVFILVGLPMAVLYVLSNIGIATIVHVDAATGEQVERPIFSTEGISDLRQRLLGDKPAEPAPIAEAPAPARKPKPPKNAARAEKPPRPGEQVVARPEITFGAAGASYTAGELEQLGPQVRPDVAPIHVDGTPGLDEQVIGQTVGKNLKAFQLCNENELRRNPGFKGGKIALTVTVGPSGIVIRASVDRPEIDQSSLGTCLKEKAKRVTFPAFDGEAFDVEIPLVLTKGS